MTRNEFRNLVSDGDLSDDAVFDEIMREAKLVIGMTPRKLSSAMRMSVPTAARWLNNVTRPAFGMRESVRRYLIRATDP